MFLYRKYYTTVLDPFKYRNIYKNLNIIEFHYRFLNPCGKGIQISTNMPSFGSAIHEIEVQFKILLFMSSSASMILLLHTLQTWLNHITQTDMESVQLMTLHAFKPFMFQDPEIH